MVSIIISHMLVYAHDRMEKERPILDAQKVIDDILMHYIKVLDLILSISHISLKQWMELNEQITKDLIELESALKKEVELNQK